MARPTQSARLTVELRTYLSSLNLMRMGQPPGLPLPGLGRNAFLGRFGTFQTRSQDKDELLPLVDATGKALGTFAPRWICHVLALRHRCAHVLLIWRSQAMGNTLVLQIRSWDKDDSPGRLDISVGGHMTATDKEAEAAALAEMLQETNLTIDDLEGRTLHPVGGYLFDENLARTISSGGTSTSVT